MALPLCLGEAAAAEVLSVEAELGGQLYGALVAFFFLEVRGQEGYHICSCFFIYISCSLLTNFVQNLGILKRADGKGGGEIIKAF